MNRKSLVENSLFNVLYKCLNIVFPLLTAGYVSRVLLPSGVGKVAYAQNIAQYFVLIAALGLPNYGTREISKARNDVKICNKIFSELFFLNALSTLICLLLYYMLIIVMPFFYSNQLLYMVTGLSILLNFLNVDWFYQGTEQYQYIAIRSFVIKLISLVSIFVFVRKQSDYIVYALIFALAGAGNNIYNVLHLRKENVRIVINELNIRTHVKPVLLLLGTTIAIELYTLLDTTMIGMFCVDESVAYYSYSMRIVKTVIVVVAAIGGVLLPRLSMYYVQNQLEECKMLVNKVLEILLYLFIPAGIGIIVCASDIIRIMYGEAFLPSVITLRIEALLIYALGFSNLFGTQVLLTFGKEKQLLIAAIIGAGSNVLLNFFLIRMLQQNGAAIASIISESLVTVMTFCWARKCIDIRVNLKNLLSSILASVLMAIVIVMISHFIENVLVRLLISICLGGLVYLVVTISMKNTVIKMLKVFIKKR